MIDRAGPVVVGDGSCPLFSLFVRWTNEERHMTDQKKKGDFDQERKGDIGGNKKAHAKGESDSRTGSKQNAGHGGHQ